MWHARVWTLLAAVAGLTLAGGAQAQATAAPINCPGKSLRVVVTFPPGGSTDAAMRIVSPLLGERLGVPVVVENRPGAGGGIGLDAVAKSPPDGCTLVLASAGGLTANPSLYPKLSYAPLRDFAPVTLFGTSPFVLIASSALPAKTVGDVIKLARAQPGRLSYASGGNGTAMHLSGELLKTTSNIFLLHIPYRGNAPAVMAAAGGETDLAVVDVASLQGLARGGRVRVLGVMGRERSPLVPDVPTLAESGAPGFESSGWFALLAPAGTPPRMIERLNADVTAVLRLREVRDRFAQAGLEPLPGTPDELARLMRSETDKWARVIKASGAKLD